MLAIISFIYIDSNSERVHTVHLPHSSWPTSSKLGQVCKDSGNLNFASTGWERAVSASVLETLERLHQPHSPFPPTYSTLPYRCDPRNSGHHNLYTQCKWFSSFIWNPSKCTQTLTDNPESTPYTSILSLNTDRQIQRFQQKIKEMTDTSL